MNSLEKLTLQKICDGKGWEVHGKLREFLKNAEITEEIPKQRTEQQNKALHVYCKLRSDSLNDAGLTVQAVLAKSMDLEWTPFRFKELMWKKSLKRLYGKDSTTKMTKQEEIDNVYNHIERYLGTEFQMETIDFPHDPDKENQKLKGIEASKQADYPVYYGPPKI